MESSSQDKHVEPPGDLQYDTERLAALQAAMMEELGFGRKEKLPLEDRKAFKGHVDIDTLDRQKKAKDPGTLEYRIAQENAEAHAAWKNVRFNDVDQATAGLDAMNLGQSHRTRMTAELEGLNSSGRGHSHRGGRGGPSSRGGGRLPNTGGNPPGRSRRKQVPIEVVMAHLRGNEIPRGGSTQAKRGFGRGRAANTARYRAVPTPEPNLSFHDNRPINELPIRQNISNHAKSGSEKGSYISAIDPRPTKHRNSFVLTDPDKFMALVWPERTSGDARNSNNRPKSRENEALVTTTSTTIIPNSTPEGHQDQLESHISAAINSDTAGKPLEAHDAKFLYENYAVTHEVEVKVDKVEGLSTIALGQGIARLFIDMGRPQIPGVIEVEVEHKVVVKIPLSEYPKYNLDSSIVSFDLGTSEKSIKWILRTTLPWKAKQFMEEIDRCKPPVAILPHDVSNAQTDLQTLSGVADVETLISFEEEEHSLQQYPSFTNDLLFLMDDQTIDQTLEAINSDSSVPLLDQISTMMAETIPPREIRSPTLQMRGVQVPTKEALGGLATSRFAAATTLVDKFLSKSLVYKSLPMDTAAALTEKISKRGLAKATQSTSNEASDARMEKIADSGTRETSGLLDEEREPNSMTSSAATAGVGANYIAGVKQEGRLQYAVEEMMSYRIHASQINNLPVSAPWVSLVNQHNHRPLTSFDIAAVSTSSNLLSSTIPARRGLDTTHSLVPAVVPVIKPTDFQGLAGSIYATRAPTKAENAETLPPRAHAGASTSSTGKSNKSRGVKTSKYSTSTLRTTSTVMETSDKAQRQPAVSSIAPCSSAGPADQSSSLNRTLIDVEPETHLNKRGRSSYSEILKSEMSGGHNRNARTLKLKDGDTVNVGSLSIKAEQVDKTADPISMDATNNGEIHSAVLRGYKNFKRCDSYSSLASKDSGETIKPIVCGGPQAPMQTKQVLQRVATSPRRASALSTNSGINSTSLTTATEGESLERDYAGDKLMDVSEEFQIKRNFERPIVTQHADTGHRLRGTEVGSGTVITSATTSICHTTMTDFAVSLKARGGLATSRYAADPKSGFSGQLKLPTQPSPSLPTKPNRTNDVPTKKTLRSSKAAERYQDDTLNKPHALQPKVRPAAEIIVRHLNSGAKSQNMAPNSVRNTQGGIVQKPPLSLRPTATEFTPPNTSTLVTPQGAVFLQPMAALTPTEPLLATVLVPDGLGGYKEVNGILAAARVPLVSHGAFQPLSMPVDENTTPESLMTAQLLPQSNMQSHSQSPPANLFLQDSSSADDF